jgi:hypothetical protein
MSNVIDLGDWLRQRHFPTPPQETAMKDELTMYRVHYMKAESWPRFMLGMELPRRATLSDTHTYLRDVEAVSLHDVFHGSQGEIWSPNGEACELIRAKGLVHTSMSVGDVIENTRSGEFWAVAMSDFKRMS